MLIKTLVVGPIETNCYVVTNEKTLECVVIDPGDESNTILDYLEDNHLTCKAIFITHGHYDHVGAVATLKEETGAVVCMNERDGHALRNSDMFPYTIAEDDVRYDDGDIIEYAGLSFTVMATPGHSPGSVSLIADGAIFCGDTLFRGSMGRTDMDGGNEDEEMRSLKKLCQLQGDYEVYPGHMDFTSLIRERTFNYYCRMAMSNY